MAKKKTAQQDVPNTDEYRQGRAAARNGIAREDAPWGEDTDQLSDWLAGYDFEKPRADDQQPDDAKAEGQTGTVSSAKTA